MGIMSAVQDMMGLDANCVQSKLEKVLGFCVGRIHYGYSEVQRGCSGCNMDYLGPGKSEHAGL